MEIKSSTDKLPVGFGHILKPTKLQLAIDGAGIDIATYLYRRQNFRSRHFGIILEADFVPPNPNVPFERLNVRAGAYGVEALADIRQQVEDISIPKIINWIKEIISLPYNSPIRRERQGISFQWHENDRELKLYHRSPPLD